MKVGFTGTQVGMTEKQRIMIVKLLFRYRPSEIHVGDCVGADEDFHKVVNYLFPDTKSVGHIPESKSKRAFCKYTEERSPLPYLTRNKNIVKEADILLATPKSEEEELRSGTWATIRYGKKAKKKVIIVAPDGKVIYFNK
jgi:hypothetical protein